MTAPLKVNGVGRDAGHDCFVSVAFSRRPTDDELRAFHDAIRGMPIAAGEEYPPSDPRWLASQVQGPIAAGGGEIDWCDACLETLKNFTGVGRVCGNSTCSMFGKIMPPSPSSSDLVERDRRIQEVANDIAGAADTIVRLTERREFLEGKYTELKNAKATIQRLEGEKAELRKDVKSQQTIIDRQQERLKELAAECSRIEIERYNEK
jgi:hypothetical protein